MGSKMRADEYPQGAGRICNAPSSRTAALGIGPYKHPMTLLENLRDCHGSRARKERAPGIPRGMMRGKCAHWLAMTRLFWICPLRRGRADRGVRPYKRCDAKSQKRADEGIGPHMVHYKIEKRAGHTFPPHRGNK